MQGMAQSVIIDSLRQVLAKQQADPGARVMTMSHLARSLYETNLPEAVRTGEQAAQLGGTLKDGQYKAFALATLTFLYGMQDSLSHAGKAIDSAIQCAARTDNRVIKGFVQFRKGWFELLKNNTDQSVGDMLQALRLLEGQQAWQYESVIYHYLASASGNWKDTASHAKYALLCLQTAYASHDLETINTALLTMGSFFQRKFRQDNTHRSLLDSALYYNRQLLANASLYANRLINHSNPAAVALNTANLYWEFFPKTYKDSAEKYIAISLNLARIIHHEEIIANCYGILSEYAMVDGNYREAEKILLMAIGELAADSSSSDLSKARIYKALASTAEKSGDATKALTYYKEHLRYNEALYNTDKLAIAKKLEAQFESEKKETELAALKERAAFNRKLNYFYIGLIIVTLLALFYIYRSYRFRLRVSMQRQQLLAHEKEEAHLQAQLKSAEAKQLELEKNEALLQASLRTEEAARLQTEQLLLQERQDRLQKELLAGTLQVEEKNEMLQSLREQLTAATEGTPVLKQLDRFINEHRRMDEEFETLKSDFAEIHPSFFIRLQEKANNSLTRLDLKYCTYILMGLSNKDIANRLNVEPKSIRMARYRIKQKLGLTKEDSLDPFIQGLV